MALAPMLGCDNGALIDVVPASGTVMMDGKPLPGVSLTLVPQEGVKGRGGYAITAEDGSFQFQTSPEQTGVPAGNYRVLFQKFTMPDGSPIPPDTIGADAGIVNQLPSIYANPEQSPISATIPPPSGESLAFNLKSRPQ